MKVIFSTCVFILFSVQLLGNQQLREVNSQKEWREVFDEARTEDRYVYVFLYSEICGFCQKMRKEVFVSDSVSTSMASDFLTVKVNSDKEFGASVVERFGIKDYPVHLFLDNKDALLNQVDGFLTVTQLYGVVHAMSDYKVSAAFYQERFELGTLDKDKAYDYTKLLFEAGQIEQAADLAQFYSTLIDSKELLFEKNKFIVQNFMTNISSSHFVFLINEEEQMIEKFGEPFYDEFIKKAFDQNLEQAIKDTNIQQVDLVVEKILLNYLSPTSLEEGKASTYQKYYLGTGQWEKYNESVFSYYHLSEKVGYLREKAQSVIDIYYHEPVLLNYAENWLRIVEKYDDDFKTQFLYGTVFLLKGNSKEAIKKANKAKKYAETDDELYTVEELLNLIEKQKKE